MKLAALSLVSFLGTALAYTGDMTYYETGLGSCGYTNSDSDFIVALSVQMMNNPPNPNNNPKCGTTINIQNPATGNQATATIVDTCQACADEDIDVSPAVFEAVDPNGLGDGRIKVNWGGSAVGGAVSGKRGLEFSA